MSHSCPQFRDRWLERLPARGESASLRSAAEGEEAMRACPACAAWVRRTAAQIRALRGLSSLEAPAELEERLFAAPSSFSARATGESTAVRALRSLPVLSAPAVLERLVAEELARPAGVRVSRFAGDLEPLRAPRTLEARVVGRLRGPRVARRWWIPAAALVAATVLAWLGAPGLGGGGGSGAPAMVGSAFHGAFHRYSFEVVHPASARALDPMTRGLAEALGGGSGRAE